MRPNPLRKWLVVSLLVTVQSLRAPARDDPTATPAPPKPATSPPTSSAAAKPATPDPAPGDAPASAARSPVQPSAAADEIVKLVQAGVAKDVIKGYIETAQVAAPLSAADVVVLKEHGVPDDIVLALLKRGAELAVQAKAAAASNATPEMVTGTVSLDALLAALRSGQLGPTYLDPEGYDYFQYYYLTPRAIASANERIYSSYPWPAYAPYAYGYRRGWGFRPRPFAP